MIYDEKDKIYKCWYSIFIKSDDEATPSDKRAWLDAGRDDAMRFVYI